MAAAEQPKWEQIDAQLCSVIKSTLHPDIKPIFHPYITYESVWIQAKNSTLMTLIGFTECVTN
jgi:hypothetical protein